MIDSLRQEHIKQLADTLRRLRAAPGSPVLDIEWLLLRCEDTLRYEGELQKDSAKQLLKDIADFERSFPNLIPRKLLPQQT